MSLHCFVIISYKEAIRKCQQSENCYQLCNNIKRSEQEEAESENQQDDNGSEDAECEKVRGKAVVMV